MISAPKSIQDVKLLQAKVMNAVEKSDALNLDESKVLREGMRRAISTTYGTFHEDKALDCYEKKVGCEVFKRNSEMISMSCIRTKDWILRG